MSALKQFTGFKGKCAFAQIGNLKFAIITKSDLDLSLLWNAIMEDVPLDPRGIKSAILIESETLPSRRLPLTPGFSQVPPATSEPKTVSTVSPIIEI